MSAIRKLLLSALLCGLPFASVYAVVSATPLPPPTLTATAIGTGVVLVWTAPTKNADGSTPAKVSGYNLYRSTSSTIKGQTCCGGAAPYIGYSAALKSVLTYTDVGAASGNYYYALSAYYCDTGGCGESPVGPIVQVGTVSTPTTPGSVVNVVGTAKFQWAIPTKRSDGSALTNLAGFKVYRGTTCAAQTTVITLTNPGLSTYNDVNVPLGSYCYALTSYDSNNLESQKSPDLLVTFVAPASLPGSPNTPVISCIATAPQGMTVNCNVTP